MLENDLSISYKRQVPILIIIKNNVLLYNTVYFIYLK